MEFKGRDIIFYLFLSMMMVPEPIYIISSYMLLDKFNWLDTYQALIVPWALIFLPFSFSVNISNPYRKNCLMLQQLTVVAFLECSGELCFLSLNLL